MSRTPYKDKESGVRGILHPGNPGVFYMGTTPVKLPRIFQITLPLGRVVRQPCLGPDAPFSQPPLRPNLPPLLSLPPTCGTSLPHTQPELHSTCCGLLFAFLGNPMLHFSFPTKKYDFNNFASE